MTSIITADIINSRKVASEQWMAPLKSVLNTYGKSPKDWEIYRGDEFQLEIKQPESALMAAIKIKALLKSFKLDARISIGVGDKDYSGKKITESNGSAFQRSGTLFETLKKEKMTLAISSGNEELDQRLNLIFRLTFSITQHWLPQSAAFVMTALDNQTLSQEEIGNLLGINQSAVSQRQKRAQFDLIMEVEQYYREQIKKLSK